MDEMPSGEFQRMVNEREDATLIRAKILAHQKRFDEVAELYKANGYEHEAMQLFTDLRMFDHAQALMTSTTGEKQKQLLRKRADWAKESNDPKLAANMFIASADYAKALNLIIQHNWMDLALVVMNKVDRNDKALLTRIADYLAEQGEHGLAAKMYINMNQVEKLIHMHIAAAHWADAFAIANRYPSLSDYTYLEYGRWLAEHDRFEEAQVAFHKAQADKVLHTLCANAVAENRFVDAAYFHWLLSVQFAERSEGQPHLVVLSKENEEKAWVYYAYDAVYTYHNEPFTRLPHETLLNMARFVSLSPMKLPNVSQVLVLFHIASIGRDMGAFKFARSALDKLSSLRVPQKMNRMIEVASVKIRAERISDMDGLLPICFVCGLANPLNGGHFCVHCKTPFVYSFSTFEVLPLAEFFVEEEMSEEAVRLIEAEPPLSTHSYNPFAAKRGERVTLSRDALSQLVPSQVFVWRAVGARPARYFFNLIPSVSVSMCDGCARFFHTDDLEMARIESGGCPMCRRPTRPPSPSFTLF